MPARRPNPTRGQRIHGTWVRLQSDLTRGTDDFSSPSSNISPFGHQIRVFDPAIAHVASFGAREATGPMQPVPSFVPFGTAIWSVKAGVDESTIAAASSRRRMACARLGWHTWCAAPRGTMGGPALSSVARQGRTSRLVHRLGRPLQSQLLLARVLRQLGS